MVNQRRNKRKNVGFLRVHTTSFLRCCMLLRLIVGSVLLWKVPLLSRQFIILKVYVLREGLDDFWEEDG